MGWPTERSAQRLENDNIFETISDDYSENTSVCEDVFFS